MDWVLKQSFNHFLASFCEPLQEDGLQLSFVDGLVVKNLVLRPDALNNILEANETDLRIEGGRIGTLRMGYTAVPGVVTMQMNDLDIRIKPNTLKTIGRTLKTKITDFVAGVPPDPPLEDQAAYEGGWIHTASNTYYHHLPTEYPQSTVALTACGDPYCPNPACRRPLFLHSQHPAAYSALHQKPIIACAELPPPTSRRSGSPSRRALCGISSSTSSSIEHCPMSRRPMGLRRPPPMLNYHPDQYLPMQHLPPPPAPLVNTAPAYRALRHIDSPPSYTPTYLQPQQSAPSYIADRAPAYYNIDATYDTSERLKGESRKAVSYNREFVQRERRARSPSSHRKRQSSNT